MRAWLFLSSVCIICFPLLGNEKVISKEIMETDINQDACDLYKIISLRDWQATQKRETVALSADDSVCIHFSTEDQIEKIIATYWSDAQQLVILKIDRSKLKGRLVYETKVGENTKYFQLYNGFIPCSAILESRIVYRQPIAPCNKDLLDIVKVGDSVLRKPARELSTDEILSSEVQKLIEMMKATMRAAPGVGLAAPQIGKSIQLVVVEDVDQSHLTFQQLAERNRFPVPFHVIINPRIYIEEGSSKSEFLEGCLSTPAFLGVVSRADSVRVECLNERAEPVVIHAKGWYARILQHEIDHLQGTLYIDRAILPTLMTEENYVKLWKEKSVQEIQASLVFKKPTSQVAQPSASRKE